jgi:phosphoenolpyruvate carboxykinase (ATP)
LSNSDTPLARELASKIIALAEEKGSFIIDRREIFDLALRDPVTLETRGTDDVIDSFGSPAFVTRTTSRSAAMTEVLFGEVDERQAGILQGAFRWLEKHLEGGGKLLVMDKMMGLHPEHSHHCRTIITPDYARMLVMWDKLIFDLPEGREAGEPDQIEIMIPEWREHAGEHGLPPVSILADADGMATWVLGSDYFGEIKKGHLRMAMYREKVLMKEGRGGGLGIHAGGKLIRARDAASEELREKGALFFGLSGTGKTTLSVHHFWLDPDRGESVVIRQDDFFSLSPDARAFGTEDNAYIKTEGLEAEGQPLLYAGATSPNAVLENVYVDPQTREVDFFRYDHPFVPGGKCFNGRGIVIRRELDYTDDKVDLDHVDLIFFITRRETVVPPLARLDTEQAAAFFMLGESILTSAADPTKAGQSVRSVGTNPFIVGSKGEEGNIFYDILRKNPGIQCFLFNTGGFGGRQVDIERESLGNPGAVEILRRYLGGFWHIDKGLGIKRALLDGTEEWSRVNQVRFELVGNGEKRLRMKEDIEKVFVDIESGRKSAVDYELVKIYCLAGQKVRIQDSAALIREIARSGIKWTREDYWGYEVPAEVPGLDLRRFDEHRYYHDNEIRKLNDQLREERINWLHSFDDLDPRIRDIFG